MARKYFFILQLCCFLSSLLLVDCSSKYRPELAPGAALPIKCLGSPASGKKIIFLHGMDTVASASKAPQAPRLLTTLADQLNLRIALPQNIYVCPDQPDKLCWKKGKREDVALMYQQILNASRKCFDNQEPRKDDFILIGFSNGGFLASRIVNLCLQPQPKTVIAIGSAGAVTHVPAGLADCASLEMLVGTHEVTNASAKKHAKDMSRLHARVRLTEFNGGHQIPERELTELLKKL